jgi:hypothetical protein
MFNLLHDWCTRSPFYWLVLRKSVHNQMRELHQDSWPSVTRNTRSLSAGLYQAGESTLTIAEMLQCLAQPKQDAITVSVHTFDFLRDLHTIGDNNSRRLARKCISHWIEHNSLWTKKPWRAPGWNLDILGYRLCNWLGFYDFFGHSADQEFRKKLLNSIGQQYRFLKRGYIRIKDPISRFRALKGLIYAGCALPRERNKLDKWLAHLQLCLNEQFDAQFNQHSRHPGTIVLLLRDLIDLRLLLRHFYAGQIDNLNDYIIRLAPIVRHLRHGDGGLSSFTGNATQRLEAFCDSALSDSLVDMALSLADSRAILPDPVAMSYVRCSSKAGFLLINTLPTLCYTKLNDWHSKSTGILDFEWSERAQRLLTRSDVSVYIQDSKNYINYRPQKNQEIKCDITHEKGVGFFDGEYQTNQDTKENLYGTILKNRRELYISPNGDIRGEDQIFLSQSGTGYLRFLAAPGLEWRITGESESAFLCKTSMDKTQKPEHLKRFLCQGNVQLNVYDVLGQQALCLTFLIPESQQISLKWALSPVN